MALTTDLEFKVVFIGDSGVGKRIDSNTYSSTGVSTIGMDLVTKVVNSTGYAVKLQLWDTAGQERFRAMVKLHSRGSRGLFMVYAVNDKISFEAISEFYESIVADPNSQRPVVFLIANKVDLPIEQHIISPKQGRELARSLGVSFFECSAKSGLGIPEVLQEMTDELVKRVESTQTALPTRAKSGLLQSPFRVGTDQKEMKDFDHEPGCQC